MEQKRRLKRKLPFVLFIVGCLLLFAGALLVAGELWLKLSGRPAGLEGNDGEAQEPLNAMTVLLLGVDARPGEKVARTDTIIVAHVEPDANRLSLLSIPRDTRVNIPRHGMDKINAANVYGGPELVSRVVSDLIGMPVPYYALTNWEGFKDIVDTLGGVTIDVEKPMNYYDPTDGPAYAINLKPGVQRLDGGKALGYVRYRNDALGDISRTERQLKFLKALAQETMRAGTLLKLPKLVPQINKSLDTNLGAKQMFSLARVAKNFDRMEIVTQTLPGHFLERGGLSYWAVDPQEAKKVALSLFKDGQVTKVVEGPSVNEDAYGREAVALKPPVKPPSDQQAAPSQPPAGPAVPVPGGKSGSGPDGNSKPDNGAKNKTAENSPGNEKKDAEKVSGSAAKPPAGSGQGTAGNLGVIPAPPNGGQKPDGTSGGGEVPVEDGRSQQPSDQPVSIKIIN